MAVPYLPGGTVTVTRLRYPITTDEYLNEIRDFGATPEALPIPGCSFQPSEGSELLTDTDRMTERGDLYAPPGADLLGTDTVVVPDRGEFQVDGPVRRWPDVGGLGHVHALLVHYREAQEYTEPLDGGGADRAALGVLDGGVA